MVLLREELERVGGIEDVLTGKLENDKKDRGPANMYTATPLRSLEGFSSERYDIAVQTP